ncbi:MAG: methylmalonyl-CoA epimerase [Bacteroidota bacterium]
MRLEHIGIAVEDPALVATLYETILGIASYKTETVAAQGVATHFLSAGTAKLELLEALTPDSPIAKFLAKRGEGLHHLAFEVPDLDDAIDRVRAAELPLIGSAPSPGADGKRVMFIHPKATHGVLIELCERDPDRWQPTAHPVGNTALDVYVAGPPSAPLLLLLTSQDVPAQFGRLAAALDPFLHIVAYRVTSGASARTLTKGFNLSGGVVLAEQDAAEFGLDVASLSSPNALFLHEPRLSEAPPLPSFTVVTRFHEGSTTPDWAMRHRTAFCLPGRSYAASDTDARLYAAALRRHLHVG